MSTLQSVQNTPDLVRLVQYPLNDFKQLFWALTDKSTPLRQPYIGRGHSLNAF